MKTPDITQRFVPPVSGKDLEQALNYTSADGLPLEMFYTSFTYPRIFYKPGSRPELERFLDAPGFKKNDEPEASIIRVYEAIRHYSLLGFPGPTDRGLSEEEVLRSGEGWCNEQARVLCALTQIRGLPSRLVFAGMPDGNGHVLVEVFHQGGWILIDQTAAYIFRDKDGRPVNLLTLRQNPSIAPEIARRYRTVLQAEKSKAVCAKHWEKFVPYGEVPDPLVLFHSVGYCNYFVY